MASGFMDNLAKNGLLGKSLGTSAQATPALDASENNKKIDVVKLVTSSGSDGSFTPSHSGGGGKINPPSTAERAGKAASGAAKTYIGSIAGAIGYSDLGGVPLAGDEYNGKNMGSPTGDAELDAYISSISQSAANSNKRKENQGVYTDAAKAFSDKMMESGSKDIERAQEGLGFVGRTLVGAGVAGAQLAADVGIGLLTGGAMAPMMVRSFGGAAQQARQKGYSEQQSVAIGIATAATEYFTEKLFGGNPAYDSGSGIVNKLVGKIVSNKAFLNILDSVPAELLSEGMEEIIADILEPAAEWAITGNRPEYELDQIIQDGVVGVFLGAIGQGGNAIANKISPKATQPDFSMLFEQGKIKPQSEAQEQTSTDMAEMQNAPSAEFNDNLTPSNPVKLDYNDVDAFNSKVDEIVSGHLRSGKVTQISADEVAAEDGKADWNDSKSARKYIKSIITRLFGDRSVYFHMGDGTLEAYFTKSAKSHYAGFPTQERSAAAQKFSEIIENADYIGSADHDVHGVASDNGSTTGWDYFVSTVQVGDRTVPFVFSIRTLDRDTRSQIYSIRTNENSEPLRTHEDGQTENSNVRLSNYDVPDGSDSANLSHEQPVVNAYDALSDEETANLRSVIRSVIFSNNTNTAKAMFDDIIKDGSVGLDDAVAEVAKRLYDYVSGSSDSNASIDDLIHRAGHMGALNYKANSNTVPGYLGRDENGNARGTVKYGTNHGNQTNTRYRSFTQEEVDAAATDASIGGLEIDNESGEILNYHAKRDELLGKDLLNVSEMAQLNMLKDFAAMHGYEKDYNDFVAKFLNQKSQEGQLLAMNNREMSNDVKAVRNARDLTEKIRNAMASLRDAKKAKLGLNEAAVENLLKHAEGNIAEAHMFYLNNDADALRDMVKRLASERGIKIGKKTGAILDDIDTITLENLYDLALSSSVGAIWDKVPKGVMQNVNNWQSISQLLNPKTLERNIITNWAFGNLESRVTNGAASIVDGFVAKVIVAQYAKAGINLTEEQARTIMLEKGYGSEESKKAAAKSAKRSFVSQTLNAPANGGQSKYTENSYHLHTGGIMGGLETALGIGLETTDAYQSGGTVGSVGESLSDWGKDENNWRQTKETRRKSIAKDVEYRNFHRGTITADFLGDINALLGQVGFGTVGNRKGKILGKDVQVKDFNAADLVNKYARFAGTAAQTVAEYTPVGLAKAVYNFYVMNEANKQIINSAKTENGVTTFEPNQSGKGRRGYEDMTAVETAVVAQRELAKSLVRPLVGGAMMGLAAILYNLGILSNEDSDDMDETMDKSNAGLRGLQLNLSALGRFLDGDNSVQDGDYLVKVSDFVPFDALMKAGVIAAQLKDKGSSADLMKILDITAKAALEQYTSLSVNDTLETIYYDVAYPYAGYTDENGNTVDADTTGDIIAKVLGDLGASNVTGFIPGPLRHIAQGTDKYSRDTSADNPLMRPVNAVRNSVPGLRQTLPEKLDAHGNPVTTGLSGAGNLANSMVNPFPVSKYHPTEVQKFSEELGEYITRKAPNSVSYKDADGNTVKDKMSVSEKRQWQQTVGSTFDYAAEVLMNAGKLDNLSKEEQAEVLAKINSYATATAKKEYLESKGIEYELGGNAKSVQNAMDSGLDFAQFFEIKNEAKNIEKELDGKGATVKASAFSKYLDQLGLSSDEKAAAMQYNHFNTISPADSNQYDRLVGEFAMSGDSAFSIVDAVLSNDHEKEYQKYRSILSTDLSEEEKLDGILSFMMKDGKLTGSGEKFEKAYNSGKYTLDELVGYKELRSNYTKKSDMIKHCKDVGISSATVMMLYNILN